MGPISGTEGECAEKTGRISIIRRAKQFKQDERGSLTVFALFMFVLMLMITGMAIDLMRYEATRTTLQNTVDRAILAAADLDNDLDPQSVVEDYFAKAGMSDFLVAVNVQEALNYRSVTADTRASIPTLFMSFNPPNQPPADHPDRRRMKYWLDNMGRNNLVAAAGGTAVEQYQDIEISMVLDVSGSMNSSSRIQNLKVAAKEFVDAVTTKEPLDPSLTTVNIIPYNATVSLGPRLGAEYNLVNSHFAPTSDGLYSHCPRFPSSAFDELAISPTTPLDLVTHFEYGSGSSKPINRPWCPTVAYRGNEIIVGSNNVSYLQGKIDDLDAYGNTAIDMGMKWGAALLDPSARPVFNNMMATGDMPAISFGRPQVYGEGLKVVVVMSDGANTTEYDVDSDHYRNGWSNIWVKRQYVGQPLHEAYNNNKNRFSIRYDGGNTDTQRDDSFFRLNVGWSDRELTHPYGYDEYDDVIVDENGLEVIPPESTDTVTRVRWSEIYATFEYKRIDSYLMYEAYDRGYISYNEYKGPEWAVDPIVNSSQADSRLSTICAKTRNTGILVYAIAFEAPSGGQAALLDCASSPSHYFDVQGTDISDAFAAIAAEITSLRLTQ
ncbi:pilus assembly protein TadG-related protein [Aliiroseovarius sp. YM-037]|uniref:pilus assembly protein TadG-related protein n=1 Tax=Aliiroseovarius sp. YM-037 TaxID=3341728 RepID=UPI003A810CF1